MKSFVFIFFLLAAFIMLTEAFAEEEIALINSNIHVVSANSAIPSNTNITQISSNKTHASKNITSPLGIVTGSLTGTYYRFAKEMRGETSKDGVELLVKESSGSIENINRISSSENAAFGIVQSDVLGFLKRSQYPRSRKLASHLRMVFPFYEEEVHVIANKKIKSFSQLNGKKVVTGSKGSGSWLTSMNLFSIAGIKPSKMLRLDPKNGLMEVLSGRADAMIFVAGKPVKLFENMNKLSSSKEYANLVKNVWLLPITDKNILKEYKKAIIKKEDYDFVQKDLQTISVTAVLVSYNFSESTSAYAKTRCEDIRKFSKSMYKRAGSLKRNGHKKWREVNLDADIGIWKRDKCAIANRATATLEDEFLSTMLDDIK